MLPLVGVTTERSYACASRAFDNLAAGSNSERGRAAAVLGSAAARHGKKDEAFNFFLLSMHLLANSSEAKDVEACNTAYTQFMALLPELPAKRWPVFAANDAGANASFLTVFG